MIAIGAVGEREREAVGLRPAAWKDFEDEEETVRDMVIDSKYNRKRRGERDKENDCRPHLNAQ